MCRFDVEKRIIDNSWSSSVTMSSIPSMQRIVNAIDHEDHVKGFNDEKQLLPDENTLKVYQTNDQKCPGRYFLDSDDKKESSILTFLTTAIQNQEISIPKEENRIRTPSQANNETFLQTSTTPTTSATSTSIDPSFSSSSPSIPTTVRKNETIVRIISPTATSIQNNTDVDTSASATQNIGTNTKTNGTDFIHDSKSNDVKKSSFAEENSTKSEIILSGICKERDTTTTTTTSSVLAGEQFTGDNASPKNNVDDNLGNKETNNKNELLNLTTTTISDEIIAPEEEHDHFETDQYLNVESPPSSPDYLLFENDDDSENVDHSFDARNTEKEEFEEDQHLDNNGDSTSDFDDDFDDLLALNPSSSQTRPLDSSYSTMMIGGNKKDPLSMMIQRLATTLCQNDQSSLLQSTRTKSLFKTSLSSMSRTQSPPNDRRRELVNKKGNAACFFKILTIFLYISVR